MFKRRKKAKQKPLVSWGEGRDHYCEFINGARTCIICGRSKRDKNFRDNFKW